MGGTATTPNPYAAYGGTTASATPATPPSGGADPYAAYGGKMASSTSATPPAGDSTLTGNPNNEGTYAMQGPKGDTVKVPYSKVGTIAHDQGYQLTGGTTWYGAPSGENARYLKDYAADPKTTADTKQFAQDVQDPGQGLVIGGARGAALTAAGLAHIARKVTGTTGSTTNAEKSAQAFGEGGDTGAEEAGKFIESAGEFMMGDEALKGLSYVDKLKQVLPALKILEKSPPLAKAMAAAIQQGTVGGAQALVKTGGDVGTAAETGVATGAFGGILSAATEGAAGFLAKRAPAAETIAGETVPSLSSQRAGTGARGDVTNAETPKVAAAQQAAAPKVFRNVAQRATKQALDEANTGRVNPTITDQARMLPAPEGSRPHTFTIPGTGAIEEDLPGGNEPRKRQIGTRVVPRVDAEGNPMESGQVNRSAKREPVFQYLTSLKPDQEIGSTSVTGGGDLQIADPETAQMHLSRLNDQVDHPEPGTTAEQQSALESARDNLQDQMDMYNAHQRTLPNFSPIDSAKAAAGVGHFGEAADQLQNAAAPIYQKIDAATDGEFGRLNKARAAAGKRGDFTAKGEIEDKLDQLIADSGAITPAERQQATRLWSTSKVLDGFHDVINNAANVDDAYASQVKGGRTLSGTKLQNGLQKMIGRYGSDRLESVVGKDGMENMTRMADLLKIPAKRSAIQHLSTNLVHNLANGKMGAGVGALVGHHLMGYEGAVGGAYAGAQAERIALRILATSPRAGQLFDYAVRNNVTPKIAAALVATEIEREQQTEPQQQQQPEEDEPPGASPKQSATPDSQLTYDIGPQQGTSINGLVQRGNIDVNHRPQIKNADGSSSTIFSMTVPVGKDGHSVPWDSPNVAGYALVPSIADGKFLTPNGKKPSETDKVAMQQLEDAATAHYDKTRQHLGVFSSDKAAETYAGSTHAWGNDGTARKVYMPSY
jgi:hypothetical protein